MPTNGDALAASRMGVGESQRTKELGTSRSKEMLAGVQATLLSEKLELATNK